MARHNALPRDCGPSLTDAELDRRILWELVYRADSPYVMDRLLSKLGTPARRDERSESSDVPPVGKVRGAS